jgi:DNA modification methylase
MKCPGIKDGTVVHGNSLDLMKCLPDASVDLIVTSPPYANKRRGLYDGVEPDEYVEWFMPFTKEMKRVLKMDGSLALNIKEGVVNGERHPYVIDTVKGMLGQGWKWMDTYSWYKSNPLPMKPARRFKDGHESIYHFTKSSDFKFFPDAVKVDGKEKSCKAYQQMITRGNAMQSRKSGKTSFNINNFAANGCAKVYPSNVINSSTSGKKSIHPAPFPETIPAFFIKALSNPGDVVLDPFAGSGTTNVAAKKLGRKTIGFDLKLDFVNEANDFIAKAMVVDPFTRSGTTSFPQKLTGTQSTSTKTRRHAR